MRRKWSAVNVQRYMGRINLLAAGFIALYLGILHGTAIGQQPVNSSRSPLPLRPIQAERGTEHQVLLADSNLPVIAGPRSNGADASSLTPGDTQSKAPQVSRKPLPTASVSGPTGRKEAVTQSKIDIALPEPPASQELKSQERLPVLSNEQSYASTSLRGNMPLLMRSPRIEVKIDGPNDVALGVPHSYQLQVRNEDAFNVQGLVLRMIVPAGVQAQKHSVSQGRILVEQVAEGGTLLTWMFENLASGELATLAIDLTARTTSNFSLGAEWTLQPISDQATIQVRAPQLKLALSGPTIAEFGQPCIYQLQITNPGTADALDVHVSLSAEQFGESSTPIGNVLAGSTEVIDVELVFHEKGEIRVAADAVAAGGLKANSEIRVQVRRAELDLLLEAPETVYHGASAPCFIKISNFGDLAARQVVARVKLPETATVIDLPEELTLEGRDIVWALSEVGADSSKEIGFYLEFRGEGENSVAVECTSEQTHVVRRTAMTNVMGFVDMKLVVTAPDAPAPVGKEVKYVLELANRGTKVAENIVILALFSKDIEPSRAEGQPAEIVPGQVRFAPIERLMPGESISLTVFAEAETDGLHRFRAEVNTPNAEVKLAQEETTQYIQSIRRSATTGLKPILR